MAYKGSLVELPLFGTYWVLERVFNFDNHLVITMKNVTYIYLLANVHALSIDQCLLLPACYLRTLGLTYITPQSSLHSVPFTVITLFLDGNYPGKPSSTTLLNSAPAYLSYDRYVHSHIWGLACNELLTLQMRVEDPSFLVHNSAQSSTTL